MKYNNHLNYKKRKKFLLKLKLALGIIFIALVGGGILFYFKYVHQVNPNTPQTTTSHTATSVITPSVRIFKTPYFQFQAPDSWLEVQNESTSNKFIYRSLRSSLIEHEIVVYVNQIPANLESSRVMPVTFKTNNTELDPGDVSGHCINVLGGKPNVNAVDIIVASVHLKCDSDTTNYTVLVGQRGGDTVLKMNRPDGTNASYSMYYTNLRAVPDSIELNDILKSFQTR